MASHKNNSHNKKTPILPSQQPRSLIVANNNYASKFSDAKFTLSFEYFDEKKCDFDSIKTSHYKKFIKLLGCLSDCKTVDDFHKKCPMEIKPIKNNGQYKRFFSGLDEDETLYEVDITNFRAFFFLMGGEKLIQIVAIAKHPESKKNHK